MLISTESREKEFTWIHACGMIVANLVLPSEKLFFMGGGGGGGGRVQVHHMMWHSHLTWYYYFQQSFHARKK